MRAFLIADFRLPIVDLLRGKGLIQIGNRQLAIENQKSAWQ
jgi:hypothetical protein